MKTLKFFIALIFCGVAIASFAFGNSAPGLSLATLPAAGDFSCSNILEILAKADAIWTDNATNKDYVANCEALQAIIGQQTAKLEPIVGQQGKDNTLKVSWLSICPTDPTEGRSTCQPGGDEAATNCKEYAPNVFANHGFSVNETTLRGSIYSPEEVVARLMLAYGKKLDEYLTETVLASLDTFKGVNNYAGAFGTVTGATVGNSETEIASANWTASLFGYLALVSKKNKLSSPFLLSGENLAIAYWNAQANAANADGKGDLNKFQSMPIIFDQFNIDSVFNPSLKTFMLDKGAVAFGAMNEYGLAPIERKGPNYLINYAIPSRNLPGVSYDVSYNTTCEVVEGRKNWKHHFTLDAACGFYLNPVGCIETNTGVLSFKKVA